MEWAQNFGRFFPLLLSFASSRLRVRKFFEEASEGAERPSTAEKGTRFA